MRTSSVWATAGRASSSLIYMESESALHNTAVSTFYGNSTTYPGLVQPSTFLSGDITLDKPKVFLSKYDARYYESIEKSSSNSYGIAKYATNSISIQPVGTNVEAFLWQPLFQFVLYCQLDPLPPDRRDAHESRGFGMHGSG